MSKQIFQVGDIAYMIDEDFKQYESKVYSVTLERNNIISYDTYDDDFTDEDIDKRVFKTEEDREIYLYMKLK